MKTKLEIPQYISFCLRELYVAMNNYQAKNFKSLVINIHYIKYNIRINVIQPNEGKVGKW